MVLLSRQNQVAVPVDAKFSDNVQLTDYTAGVSTDSDDLGAIHSFIHRACKATEAITSIALVLSLVPFQKSPTYIMPRMIVEVEKIRRDTFDRRCLLLLPVEVPSVN